MSDPLTDPRAQDLLNADCGEIEGIHQIFATVATQATDCVSVLGRIASSPTWTGPAADAAKSSIQSLAPKLTQIGDAYTQSASALWAYSDTVTTVQPQFKALQQQLQSTAATISSLSGTESQQQGALQSAVTIKRLTVSNDPSTSDVKAMNKTITGDSSALGETDSQLSSAQGTLATQQAQGMALLQVFSDARQSAIARVTGLAHQAPQESGWDKLVHGVGNVMGDGVSFVEGMGKTVFNAVTSLPSDIDKVYDHPGNLGDWEKLGKDAAVTLAAASVAVGGFAAVGGIAGADGAAATLSGVADTLDTVGTAVGTANSAGDILQGNYSSAALDYLGGKVPDASNALGVGEDGVDEAVGTAEANDAMATAYQAGENTSQAYGSLSDAQKEALSSSGIPLSAGAATSAEDASAAEARAALQKYNSVGRGMKYTEETTKDQVEDKINDKLQPAGAS
jgi:hypothetical protein